MWYLLEFLTLFLVFSNKSVNSRVLIVDGKVKASNSSTGSLEKPFLTIQQCINELKSTGKPGDECHIREGHYHENVTIDGLFGEYHSPYVIRGFQNERPLIDGTVRIKPALQWKWKPLRKGSKIFRTKIRQDIWQLFVDGQMMTNARWPNAKWSDYSLFNGSLWGRLGAGSRKGFMVNRGNSLADTNISMKDAVAILNIGSYNTYAAIISNHTAGHNEFTYKDTFGDYDFKPSISKYFIEDKLELLDAPEEWFYNKNTKQLYVWLPNGGSPKNHQLHGKVQTYAIKVTNSRNVVLKNLDFFATTISATSSKWANVDQIRFDSLRFNYPTYSKRMLGDVSLIDRSLALGKSKKAYGSFVFFNNTFYGSDGTFLQVNGKNVSYENNLIEYNDWSGVNMIYKTGGDGPINTFSQREYYIRNTMRYNGASTGLQPGHYPYIHLNRIIGQCWGIIQNDGAGVQVKIGSQFMSNVSYNWVHSSPKYGLRFDGQPPRVGKNGTMSHNVAFQTNGIMVKGDNHLVENNLAFDKYNENDGDFQGTGCTLCVLKFVRKNPVEINKDTVVINNIADRANGGKDKWHKGKIFPVAGRTVRNNIFNANISQEITDPRNFDFRPVAESMTALNDIGPYKFDPSMKHYWIPGRQIYKTSTPVPKHGSKTVEAKRRDALMFLQAYNCTKHTVYFGTDEDEVSNAESPSDSTYMETLYDGINILYLTDHVRSETTYFWRVDAEMLDGVVYKGDVWNFTTN